MVHVPLVHSVPVVLVFLFSSNTPDMLTYQDAFHSPFSDTSVAHSCNNFRYFSKFTFPKAFSGYLFNISTPPVLFIFHSCFIFLHSLTNDSLNHLVLNSLFVGCLPLLKLNYKRAFSAWFNSVFSALRRVPSP